MLDDDSILNASVLYSKEEVLAEFWESCEADSLLMKPPQHLSLTSAKRRRQQWQN
jgi:hypothetical protein